MKHNNRIKEMRTIKIKQIALTLLLAVLASVLCSCGGSDGLWGIYTTEKDARGNYKSVEFAYSKTFYTTDALSAEAQAEEEENDALLEGWYETEEDQVICSFTLSEGEQTKKITYTFRYDNEQDSLTLTGHTEDGQAFPITENEVYTKE